MTVRFDDLEDFDAPATSKVFGIIVPNDITEAKGQTIKENCPKCSGTGIYYGYSRHGRQCFKCNGTGHLEFKTTAAQRAKSRESAANRKEKVKFMNLGAFERAHPDIAAWWTGNDFSFAIALREAVTKYGSLTDRQMASAMKCIESSKARQAQKQQTVVEAPAVDITAVVASLRRGQEKGIRKPILRLANENGAFTLSLAWDGGKNPGAVYVTGAGREDYFGKIIDGKFIKSNACDSVKESAILAVCANPETAAIAYGRQFGICSCCGRELTNKKSIELGIGPICLAKFF